MIFDRLLEKRASLENPSTSLSDPDAWLYHAFGAQSTTSNVVVNEKNATQITAFWSAINTIADTLGELPFKLVRDKRNGASIPVRAHPTLPLLRLTPNPVMSSMVFKSTTQAHALTWGNGYSWIKRDRTGAPGELWPLMPAVTTPIMENGRLWFETELDIGKTRLAAEDVLHIPALSRNGIVGMSIIQEQREALAQNIAVNQFGSKFFANGAKPGGLVSYPGKVRDPEKIKQAIERAAGGENQHGVLVLSDDAKYTPFGIPPDDAQFLGTKEFGVDEVARMFRLPSHFLNKMGQATFNNIEQMGTHFAQYTMMPWIIRWEQELTRKLLTVEEIKKGFKFKVNVSALVRGDLKTRSEVYSKAIQTGWMTRNEVRALEDMNPLDGLDDPLMPSNLLIVGEEAEPTEDAPVEPEPVDDESDEEEEVDETDRNYVVLSALVQRLANKEACAMRRIANKQYNADELTDEITRFYRSHQELLVENLALTTETARQYCLDHAIEFVEANDAEKVLLRWTTEAVSDLVNKLNEDML